ncbi:tetraspanin-33-like [Haliotis asinina]|uniref:tetraspanin-33-like n=1 Tax=Haliotis asinina TaxID=109174 RepID=UPI003531ED97
MPGAGDVTPTDSITQQSIVVSSSSWIDRCCDCNLWIKYSLFVINFLVWTAGCVMLGIGIWARLQKKGLTFFDHVITDPAYMLIVVGSVMFFISIFGCIGALRENICLLRTYILTIVVVFVVQVVAGILAFVLMDKVEKAMMDYMQHAITHYGDNNDIRDAIDFLQKQFYCCGAASYSDWEVNAYYNCSSAALSHCGVPRSCCRVPTSAQCGFHIRKYLDTYAEQFVFTQGCIGSLMFAFKDNLIVIGLIALCVGFLELFSMLLAHNMVRYIFIDQKMFE